MEHRFDCPLHQVPAGGLPAAAHQAGHCRCHCRAGADVHRCATGGVVMSRQYNHDPRHFRFPRTMEQTGYAMEDCGGRSRIADKIVVAVSIAILLLLMVAL